MLHESSRKTLKCLSLFFAILAFVATLANSSLAQEEKTIYQFQGQTENINDGANPWAPLAVGPDGSLYGTTYYGGTATCDDRDGFAYNCGAIFQLSPPKAKGLPWTESILQSFGIPGSPGYWPESAGLTLDSAGNLYGTNFNGGVFGCGNWPVYFLCGTAFELVRPANQGDSWQWKVIYEFQPGFDANTPFAGLIFDSKGNLYGVTSYGGSQDAGAVYRLTPPASAGGAWSETVLYSFWPGTHLRDGAGPDSPILIDSKGDLFGTTSSGGTGSGRPCIINGGCGTVFELVPPQVEGNPWTEKTLYSFQGRSDGYGPNGVVMGSDGSLYGTTQGFITNCTAMGGCGTVFRLSPPTREGEPWAETTLYSFPGGLGGQNPLGNLVVDREGRLYGTTSGGGGLNCGGVPGCGTVFGLVQNNGTWSESILYRFNQTDSVQRGVSPSGFNPLAGLTLGKNGELYGTASQGGIFNCQVDYQGVPCGTVFEITK